MKKFLSGLAGLGLLALASSSSAHAQGCKTFEQADCFRIDIPSVLDGPGVVMEQDGKPSGPKNVQAVKDGAVQPAGKRSFTILVWGMKQENASVLAQYSGGASANVPEIAPTMAPAFDPVHKPVGTPRAFRVTADSSMVHFQMPWSVISNETTVLICADGATVYPNRVTAKNGLWLMPADFNGWRGRFHRGTMRAFVWKN